MAEQSDHLHYIDDIFALGIPDLTGVVFLILLQRLFLPIYVHSLTKRHPPSASDSSVSRAPLYSDLHPQPFYINITNSETVLTQCSNQVHAASLLLRFYASRLSDLYCPTLTATVLTLW